MQKKINIYDEIVLPHRLLIRPFKTFEQIKEKQIGTFTGASILLLFYCFINVLVYQYLGFIFNSNNPQNLNMFLIIITSIIPIVIFNVANLAISSLLDGKGNLLEIYKVIGYSLYPLIIAKLIMIGLSNFTIADELSLIRTIYIGGAVIAAIIFFVGLGVIHEYGLFKNILSLLLSFFAMLIIIFIFLLMVNLIAQLLGFSQSIIKELIYRIRVF